MEFVRLLHSWGRWLVLVLLVVALVKFAVGLARKRPFNASSVTLMKVFNAVLGVQFLLGLALLASMAQNLTRQHYEHGFAMLLAVGLTGFLPSRWRALPDAKRQRNHLLLAVAVAGLIVAGIFRLAPDLRWRFLTL